MSLFERHAFVAITTKDLDRARVFWTETLGLPVIEENAGDFFMLDAGGVRMCVDREDGDLRKAEGSDPSIGLKVSSLDPVMKTLRERGLEPERGPVKTPKGSYAVYRDPDGRAVIVSEVD